jgi:hypothetical protein
MSTNLIKNGYLSIPLQAFAHFQEWGQCDIVVASTNTILGSSEALYVQRLKASILFWANSHSISKFGQNSKTM